MCKNELQNCFNNNAYKRLSLDPTRNKMEDDFVHLKDSAAKAFKAVFHGMTPRGKSLLKTLGIGNDGSPPLPKDRF